MRESIKIVSVVIGLQAKQIFYLSILHSKHITMDNNNYYCNPWYSPEHYSGDFF